MIIVSYPVTPEYRQRICERIKTDAFLEGIMEKSRTLKVAKNEFQSQPCYLLSDIGKF